MNCGGGVAAVGGADVAAGVGAGVAAVGGVGEGGSHVNIFAPVHGLPRVGRPDGEHVSVGVDEDGGDGGGRVVDDRFGSFSSKNSSAATDAGEFQASMSAGEFTGGVDCRLTGESSSGDTSRWRGARVVSGVSTGDSNFLLFAARVLLATGGVAVGT